MHVNVLSGLPFFTSHAHESPLISAGSGNSGARMPGLELVHSNCRKKRKLNASELFWHLPPFQPVVQDECEPPKPSQAKTSRADEGLPHLSSWQSSQTVYSSPHGLNVPVHVEGSPEHINGPLAGLLPSHLVQPPGGLAAPSTPSAPSPAGMTAHARRCSL